ncbi:MAG: peptidase M14 [Oscillatoriales cyanobacterium SM2_2_1]|nr:peptidase M14 [Oscillatoriales cyanobacterium SM2_2_1]
MLNVLDHLPEGLLALESTELHTLVPSLTLIHLQGEMDPPLFISVLLHGNETTSWLVVRSLLKKYGRALPRSVSLLIGNVQAARQRQRHLPDQPDYNRIWAGGDGVEHRMAQLVLQELRSRGVFACLDLHNNTGRNPYYGCIPRLEPDFLSLARLFAPIAVYYTAPQTVLAYAFSAFCPSVILECGLPDLPASTAYGLAFLERCLHLKSLGDVPQTPLELLHTIAVLKVPPEVTLSFDPLTAADLYLPLDLDRWNFQALPTTQAIARIGSQQGCLLALDESGQECTEQFLHQAGGAWYLRQPLIPAMLTLNAEIIRTDCLCYLMERIPSLG